MRIGIDAGHGGKDPGAVSGNVKEKDINLSIALMVKELAEKRKHTVIMTREIDFFLSLTERTRLLNRNKMDFTVSIHCNASGNESAGGCWLIFRDGLPNSSALAWNIENEFVRQCPSLSPPAPKVLGAIKASGKRLTMVYGPKPTHGAVLIECAFLTNDNDRALLQKKSVQRGIAKAIVYGAEGRFREINGK